MIENKVLLEIIKENFDLKISHHEIENLVGKSIRSHEVIKLFESIGIPMTMKANSYEFRKIDFLEREVIKEKIDQLDSKMPIRLEVEEVIETTSRYFSDKDLARDKYSLCFSEFQTQGRGRGSNQWLSPYGSGICFSIIGHLSSESSPIGLSIYCGITLARILRELGYEDVSLKWPNDLIHDGKKLGGILTELSSHSSKDYMFNIGIGVNYDLGPHLNSMQENDFPPTDLLQIKQAVDHSRSELSGFIAKAIIESMYDFDQQSMLNALNYWPEYDVLHQKEVKIIEGHKCIKGKNIGIHHTGALLIEQHGAIKRVNNGHLVI